MQCLLVMLLSERSCHDAYVRRPACSSRGPSPPHDADTNIPISCSAFVPWLRTETPPSAVTHLTPPRKTGEMHADKGESKACHGWHSCDFGKLQRRMRTSRGSMSNKIQGISMVVAKSLQGMRAQCNCARGLVVEKQLLCKVSPDDLLAQYGMLLWPAQPRSPRSHSRQRKGAPLASPPTTVRPSPRGKSQQLPPLQSPRSAEKEDEQTKVSMGLSKCEHVMLPLLPLCGLSGR
eukprot:6084933-Amphidinium_carterae.1